MPTCVRGRLEGWETDGREVGVERSSSLGLHLPFCGWAMRTRLRDPAFRAYPCYLTNIQPWVNWNPAVLSVKSK